MKAKFLFLVAVILIPMTLGAQNDYWFQKGLNATDPKEKIKYYTKSIEKEGADPATYFNRGLAKSILEDFKGAIADYSKAIEINSKNADTYYVRGIAKYNLNDYEGAIADYSKAIEIDPDYISAYKDRGYLKNDLQDYQGAIYDFSKVIEFDSNDVDMHFDRGRAKFLLNDNNGALADFEKVLEIDPNNFGAILFRTIVNEDLKYNNSGGVVIQNIYGNPKTSVIGTGCILKGGYVITCAHIIKSNEDNKEILISTADSIYYCNQIYYIDRFVDLALLKVDNLPKDIGFELYDYEDRQINDSVIDAEIYKTEIVGNPMTFKMEPLVISKFENASSAAFLNSIFLNGYNATYDLTFGNSGSPIIYDNRIIGIVFGGIPYSKIEILKGVIVSTEYLTYVIKHIENFKPFTINNIPDRTTIYSSNGTAIGYSNLIETEKAQLSGNVDFNLDSASIHMSIKEGMLNGLFKIQIGNHPFIEINFTDGVKNGEIKIFSLLNYVRIKGNFKNDLPIGEWIIYNEYNDQIASVPYNQLNLFHLYEDLAKATSNNYILKYNMDGFTFSPSKFNTYFVNKLKLQLEDEKLSNNFEVIFTLPFCFNKEKLDLLAKKALENSILNNNN